ncbi:MAG: hypothetical protein ACRC10_00640 [Thermoguttaceae bacterium]
MSDEMFAQQVSVPRLQKISQIAHLSVLTVCTGVALSLSAIIFRL